MLVLPVMVIIAVALKVELKDPIFARSPRLGRDKREFTVYQFRTWRVCERCGIEHPYHVTRVGALLRRSALDRLPRLFNILLGHMSFIGPTPIRPNEAASPSPPPAVFSVRPGLTGLAQVSDPPSGIITVKEWFDHRFDLDLQYIVRRSWRENLGVLWATIRVPLLSRSPWVRRASSR